MWGVACVVRAPQGAREEALLRGAQELCSAKVGAEEARATAVRRCAEVSSRGRYYFLQVRGMTVRGGDMMY